MELGFELGTFWVDECTVRLTTPKLLSPMRKILAKGRVTEDKCESLITPIYEKAVGFSCENHRGMSLVGIASKFFANEIIS